MLSRLIPLVAILVVLVTGACSQTETVLPKLQIEPETQTVVTQVPPTVIPATTEPVSTPAVPLLMTTPDPSFRSCFRREAGLTPIFANDKVCIQVSNAQASLKDTTFAWIINPASVVEMNSWVDEIGMWLKDKGIDACSYKTKYLLTLYHGPLFDMYPNGAEMAVSKLPDARFTPTVCSK